jgi:aminopeptidase N
MLRDMWGEERFRDVIQEYMRRWNGMHPTPWDFFNTLEDVTGESLGWLIRPWFFEYGAPDLALGAVEREGDSYRIVALFVMAARDGQFDDLDDPPERMLHD